MDGQSYNYTRLIIRIAFGAICLGTNAIAQPMSWASSPTPITPVKATGDKPSVTLTIKSGTTVIPNSNAALKGIVSLFVTIKARSSSPNNLITRSTLVWVTQAGVKMAFANISTVNTICALSCTYQVNVNTSTFADMTGQIYADATVAGGNIGIDGPYTAQFKNASTPPAVALLSPANGSTVSGSISVSLNASDNIGLSIVYLLLDGVVIYSGKNSPVTVPINTNNYKDGSHSLMAYAFNVRNQYTISNTVLINIKNTQPAVTVQPLASTISPSILSGVSPTLVLSDPNNKDTLFITQSGKDILTSFDGSKWTTFTGPFSNIILKGNTGAHNVTITSSVTIENNIFCAAGCTITAQGTKRNTIVTYDPVITHQASVINGNAFTSAWVVSNDTVNNVKAPRKHVVANVVSPAAPSDIGSYGAPVSRSSFPLWHPVLPPNMNDVNQGSVGDCYFLAPLSSFAGGVVPGTNTIIGNPDMLHEKAVELADGTVLTEWNSKTSPGTPAFIRVTKDLSAYYAAPFAKYTWNPGVIWAPILEKAFAYYRSGANTYASISGGYMYEPTNGLGGYAYDYDYFSGSWINVATNKSQTRDAFRSKWQAQLAALQVGSFGSGAGTYPSNTRLYVNANTPIVGGHAYAYLGSYLINKQQVDVFRNPWGFDYSGAASGVLNISDSTMDSSFVWGPYTKNIPDLSKY